MATPVVLTTGARPITPVESGGVPMTPVDTLGEPVTVVDALGEPVVLINNDGTPAFLAYSAKTYLGGVAPYHWFDFVNNRALYAGIDVGNVTGATGYSFTRASQGYYTNADGTLTSFASGALRRGNRGVLIEGARTNLLLRSQEFQTTWTSVVSGGASVTVTDNQVTAPDGALTADKVDFSASIATENCTLRQGVFGLANPTTLSPSIYIRADAPVTLFMRRGDGTVLESISVTTSWQRIAATSGSNAATSFNFDLSPKATSGGTNSAVTVYLWGAQLEAASFPSSYIPTTTAAITRAADVLTCTAGVSAPCTLFAEFESSSNTGGSIAAGLGRASVDNEWTARIRRNGTAIQGGTATTSDTGSTSVTVGSGALTRKAAYRAAENDFALSVAGGTVSTDVSGVMPAAPTQLVIGSGSGIAYFLFGYVTRAAIFNSALSDAQLQTVST